MEVYSNIDEIIANLKLLNETIQTDTEESVDLLSIIAHGTAIDNVLPYSADILGGGSTYRQIRDNITLTNYGMSAEIVANDPNSMFYEYGTGIMGESLPHPQASQANWVYNVPTEYKVKENGNIGWYHDFGSGNIFTIGQPANAFMFKAFETVKENNKKLLKSVGSGAINE